MATYPDSLLILNGKSAGNDLLRQAITELREDGACIHVRVTFEKGDAARYIDEGIRLGVQTIISGGGDGTINEIAGALMYTMPATTKQPEARTFYTKQRMLRADSKFYNEFAIAGKNGYTTAAGHTQCMVARRDGLT